MLTVMGGNAVKIDANARIKICPRCGNAYHGAPALSRRDNETLVCPDCGTREALESMGVDPDEPMSFSLAGTKGEVLLKAES